MKKRILFVVLYVVGMLSVKSQNSAVSSHFTFSGTGAADIISMQVRVPADGVATYTYYEVLGWSGYAGGYAGIQQSPNGRNYIFSIWDNDMQRGPIKEVYTGYGTTTESFGGEGTGLKSWTFAIPWETDSWYTLTARCWPVGDHTYYGYWIKDGISGEWKHLVTMDVDLNNLSFPSKNDAFLEDWLSTGYNRREMHMRQCWRRTTSGSWVPSHFGTHQVNYWDYDEPSDRSYNYKNNWDAGVESDNTGSYYKMISGGASTVNSIANGTIFTLPIQESKPVQDVGEVIELTAEHAGSQLHLSWDLAKTKLPQFSYKVAVYDNQAMQGEPIGYLENGAPHDRNCSIVFKQAAGTYYGQFTLIDLFDNKQLTTFTFDVEDKTTDIGLQSIEAMNSIGCLTTNLGLKFNVANYGSQNLTSFVANVYLNGAFLMSKVYSTSLARFEESEFLLENINLGLHSEYNIKLIVDYVPGSYTDENLVDNEQSLILQYEGQLLEGLNVSVVSVSSYYSGNDADNLFDNDNATIWHNNWPVNAPLPHILVFDLGEICTLTGMDMLNRQNNSNGMPKDAEIYTSLDGVSWSEPLNVQFTNTINWQTVFFEGPVVTKFLKLKITSTIPGQNVCSMAELKFRGCDSSASTNIGEASTKSFIKITAVPNPVNDILTAHIKAESPFQTLELFNSNGEMLLSKIDVREMTNANVRINMSEFASGLYFLVATTSTNRKAVKVVKK